MGRSNKRRDVDVSTLNFKRNKLTFLNRINSCFKEDLKLVVMKRSRSMMMWRRDDGTKLSMIEVDLQGDRCSNLIQGV